MTSTTSWSEHHDLSTISVTLEWPRDHVEQLAKLWFHRDGNGKPLSASKIARMMPIAPNGRQRTKRSIVGKIERLGWEHRPSPIKRSADGNVSVLIKRSHKKKTLPKIGRPEDHPEDQFPPNLLTSAEKMTLGPRACVWPIGDPKKADFKFCGCKVEKVVIVMADGTKRPSYRPYCAEHCAAAYIKPPVRKLAEAA